ncbi:MAG: DinB family protein [Usitatibacter sp.]
MNAADFPRLGLAESIERLDSMPEFLDAALEEAGDERHRARPTTDEFCLLEHACHLRDLEREGYLLRLRRMLTEEAPALQGFDGATVARERDYLAQDSRLATQEFAAARRELVGLIAHLTEQDLRREGTLMGNPVCLADVIAMMVEHDRGHREEIERLVESLED